MTRYSSSQTTKANEYPNKRLRAFSSGPNIDGHPSISHPFHNFLPDHAAAHISAPHPVFHPPPPSQFPSTHSHSSSIYQLPLHSPLIPLFPCIACMTDFFLRSALTQLPSSTLAPVVLSSSLFRLPKHESLPAKLPSKSAQTQQSVIFECQFT